MSHYFESALASELKASVDRAAIAMNSVESDATLAGSASGSLLRGANSRHAREVAAINRHAEQLNARAQDVLTFQSCVED